MAGKSERFMFELIDTQDDDGYIGIYDSSLNLTVKQKMESSGHKLLPCVLSWML